MRLGARVNQRLWAEDAEYRQLLSEHFELATLCRFQLNNSGPALVELSQELTRRGFLVHAHRFFCKRDRIPFEEALNERDAISKLQTLVRTNVAAVAHCHSLDIFNEIIHGYWLVKSLPWLANVGQDWMRIVLTTARETAPGLKLYWNEYALKNSDYWDFLYRRCRPLAEEGLLDGVGIQIHSRLDHWWKEGQTLLGPDFYPSFSRAKFNRQADRFKWLGLEVRVSECSVVSRPGRDGGKAKLYQNYFDYATKTEADAFILWHPFDGHPDVGGYQDRQRSPSGNPGWWAWDDGHRIKPWAEPMLTEARRQRLLR